ncbi:type VII secretion integral membrane protein EccD, partial [Tsukamurella soli]
AAWCGVGAALLLATAVLVGRRARGDLTPVGLAAAGIVLAAGGGACAVPLPGGEGFGAANLLLGSAAAGCAALLAARLVGRGLGLYAAVACAAALSGTAAGAGVFAPGHRVPLAATVGAVGYVVVTLAPRVGAIAGRLPLPRVPAAGERIDPIGDDPPPVIAGVDAVSLDAEIAGARGETEATTVTPRPPVVDESRVAVASAVTTGTVVGASLTAAAGAVVVGTDAPELRWHHVAFVLVIAVTLALRGRTHADPVQAGVPIAAGAAIAVATAAAIACGYGWWPVFGLTGIAVIASVALLCGVTAPLAAFTPVQRRGTELAEYLAVAATAPLLAWVWGVFATVRNL